MAKSKLLQNLTRRERQMMDAIYKLRKATALEVQKNIPNAPSINAVRRLISILEEKGYVKHKWHGPQHVYFPVVPLEHASSSAIEHLKETFFKGSTYQAMAALMKQSGSDLEEEELESLSELIEEVKKQKR